MSIGRRPVFLICTFGFFGTVVWAGAAQSFASLMASRILNAFFSSAGEALGAAIVADLFFLHERGKWMGVYMFSLANGTAFGTVVSGFLITAKGWRWLFWVYRPKAALINSLQRYYPVSVQLRCSSSSLRRSINELRIRLISLNRRIRPKKQKATKLAKSLLQLPNLRHSFNFSNPGPESTRTQVSLISSSVHISSYVTRPSSTQLSISPPSWHGVCASRTLTPRYIKLRHINSRLGINALIKLCSMIGATIGAYAGGDLSDKYAAWHAKKNGGIFEPEFRLVPLVLPLLIVPAGLLM